MNWQTRLAIRTNTNFQCCNSEDNVLKMSSRLVASVSIQINASIYRVWDALTNPDLISKYMFGTVVISDWNEGSTILWRGTWEGKSYEDKGVILKKVPFKTLKISHFSLLSGLPDKAENYHILIYNLSSFGTQTTLHFSQDNNSDEKSRNHSQKNWEMMFAKLKNILEE